MTLTNMFERVAQVIGEYEDSSGITIGCKIYINYQVFYYDGEKIILTKEVEKNGR